jgi:hypothetical protein
MDDRFEPVVGLRDRRRIEGVRFDDVGAGGEVLGVHAANDVGPGQRQEVVVALEVVRMRGETRICVQSARSAVVGFAEAVALDHRPHRTVEDEESALQEGGKFGAAVRLHLKPQNEKPVQQVRANGFQGSKHARFSRICCAPAS